MTKQPTLALSHQQPVYSHEWLLLSELSPHPEVQRGFVRAHAEAIAAAFDPEAFGELYVIKTEHGYLIWDGQHRWYAAKKYLGDSQRVYCRVYQDVPKADLARRSLLLNTQKSWNPIDRYKLRVTSNEWKARAVCGVLHQFDLKIAAQSEAGCVAAVAACDWVIDKCGGPGALERAVRILHTAWGRDRDAYHNAMIRGAALVCKSYNGKLDDAALSAKLAKSGGPARMVGRARDYAKIGAKAVPFAVAEILINEYNKGLGKNRLPKFNG